MLVFIIASLIKTALALFIVLTAVAYSVWLERKVVGTCRTAGGLRAWARSGYYSQRRTGEISFQRRFDATARIQAVIYCSADPRRDFCVDFDCAYSVGK